MSGEVNVIPTLRKFRGGPVEAFWGGGQSRGGGQLKKNPVVLKFDQNFDDNLNFVDIFKPTNSTLPKTQETPELSAFAHIQCQLQVQSLQPDSTSSFFCICHFLSFAKVHHHYKDQNAQFSGDFNIIECSRVSKVSSQQLKTHSHSQYYKINSS